MCMVDFYCHVLFTATAASSTVLFFFRRRHRGLTPKPHHSCHRGCPRHAAPGVSGTSQLPLSHVCLCLFRFHFNLFVWSRQVCILSLYVCRLISIKSVYLYDYYCNYTWLWPFVFNHAEHRRPLSIAIFHSAHQPCQLFLLFFAVSTYNNGSRHLPNLPWRSRLRCGHLCWD